MFDQILEGMRKASESTLQAQQDVLKQWVQQFSWTPAGVQYAAGKRDATQLKRWTEFATESLEKHRELLDASYRTGIQLIEQSLRATDAKSPEEFQRLLDELNRKLQESVKEHAEMQFREFQRAASRIAELTQVQA
jgi:hypothetical protein